MMAWCLVEDGVLVGAVLASGLPRDELAMALGEWVLEGCTPILHDFGQYPILIGAPLPPSTALFDQLPVRYRPFTDLPGSAP